MYEPRLNNGQKRKAHELEERTTKSFSWLASTLVLASTYSTSVWILIEVMPKPKPNKMSVKMRAPKKRPLSRIPVLAFLPDRIVRIFQKSQLARHVAGECDGKSAMTPVCESIQKIRIKSRIIVFVQEDKKVHLLFSWWLCMHCNDMHIKATY